MMRNHISCSYVDACYVIDACRLSLTSPIQSVALHNHSRTRTPFARLHRHGDVFCLLKLFHGHGI
jgi:hypothetical protein